MELQARQQVEINFWKYSPIERPEADSLQVMLDKAIDASIFSDCLKPYATVFNSAETILELGAGQGWASCFIKRLCPTAFVTTTDISDWALQSIHKWEYIYRVKIDETIACKSYEIPKPDQSIDLIFCFAAAHHFVAHRRTLQEIARVLKPNGHCYYFYEPSCLAFLYSLAHWRVNHKRPEVPEDVLIYPKIEAIARESGLVCTPNFYPHTFRRGGSETLYYMILSKLPYLQRLLPCSINYQFVKP